MKKLIIVLCLLSYPFILIGQNIEINQITATKVSGGINLNILVTTFNGAGYLSNSYVVNENSIDISVCYWFNDYHPVYQISNEIFIPLTSDHDFTINVSTFHSSSMVVCDYYANGPTGTASTLSVEKNAKHELLIVYPNPTDGKIEMVADSIKSIKIFDSLGKLIVNSSYKNIDITNFANGIYFLQVETENKTFTKKIVKQ